MSPFGERATRRLARTLLRVAFDADEADEIVRDVTELTRDRQRESRAWAFWTAVLSYPAWEARERIRAWSRGEERGRTMETIAEDVGFAWRSLRRRPGFVLTALAILGAGFASVVAVQSVVTEVLLEPLPLPAPERLVTLWMVNQEGKRARMTPGHLRDVEGLTEAFSGVAAFQATWGGLTDPESGTTIMLRGAAVTPAYFQTLGVTPIRGRAFVETDADPDEESVVILSHHVWRQVFGEDPGIVGRWIDIGGRRSRVVGVVPPGVYPTSASVSGKLPFTEADEDFFQVIRFRGDYWDLRRPHLLGGIARLRDGTSPQAAEAALDLLSSRVRAAYALNSGERIVMSPLHEEIVGDVRFGLVTLLVVVGLVFTIAAVNVGSLFLLRAEERSSEVALLTAVGAPAARVLRQRIAEAWIVGGAAAVVGTLAAGWMIDAMQRLVPYQIPRLAEAVVRPSAVGCALAIAAALALVLGFATRGSDGRAGAWSRVTGSRRTGRVQSVLIAGQAGLAVVVLAGALLLSRSLAALRATDPGFDFRETWVVQLQGPDIDRAHVLERVRALPGVASAAFTYDHPLQRSWQDGFQLLGRTGERGDTVEQATIRPYGEGFFETVGIPVLQGRLPDRAERAGNHRLAVVNDAFRRAYLGDDFLPGRDRVRIPSGDRRLGDGESVFDIVGVVADVRFLGPALPSEPAIYVPFEHFAVGGSVLLVRPARAGLALLPALRTTIFEAAPSVALDEAGTLHTLRDEAMARPRFNTMLLAVMSVVGLLLCTLGAYGIVSRAVATRRREIGVRAALGAPGRTITRSVMWRAYRPLVIGTCAGVVVSLGASRLLASLLYELSPSDPVSLVGAPLILLVVGGVAALVPSLRALAVDPAESLRAE